MVETTSIKLPVLTLTVDVLPENTNKLYCFAVLSDGKIAGVVSEASIRLALRHLEGSKAEDKRRKAKKDRPAHPKCYICKGKGWFWGGERGELQQDCDCEEAYDEFGGEK